MSGLKKKNVQPFEQGVIQGVQIRPLRKHRDDRGWLMELFRADEINPRIMPVMSYVSETLPGVTRGPHEHADQTDFFCFLGPSTFRVVLWDNRPNSSSYWVRQEVLVGENHPCVVIVPEGIVHAYRNIGHIPGWVINFPNRLYAGERREKPVDEIRREADPSTPFHVE